MKKQGFTLIEMMVVLGIIMVLMLLVIPNVTSKNDVIKDKGCEALIDVIDAQIQLFEISEGYLPSSVQELIDKGYLTAKQGVCPNGKGIGISRGQAYHE